MTITPADVDFGDMKPEDVVSREISLTNHTDSEAVIQGIGKACGCTSVEMVAMAIPARGTVTGRVSVDPQRWGKGAQTKPVTFRFADKRELVLPGTASLRTIKD